MFLLAKSNVAQFKSLLFCVSKFSTIARKQNAGVATLVESKRSLFCSYLYFPQLAAAAKKDDSAHLHFSFSFFVFCSTRKRFVYSRTIDLSRLSRPRDARSRLIYEFGERLCAPIKQFGVDLAIEIAPRSARAHKSRLRRRRDQAMLSSERCEGCERARAPRIESRIRGVKAENKRATPPWVTLLARIHTLARSRLRRSQLMKMRRRV